MFAFIINQLYKLVTASGIILRLMPIVRWIWMLVTPEFSNYKVKDEDGKTMNLVKYKGRLYPAFGVNRIAGVSKVQIRADDVLLCGYPKTGCHWMHEILFMLVNGKAEMTKYGKGLGGMIEAIIPIILDSHPSPRILNSHFRYDELPVQVKEKKIKIVWTVRSPKDTAVSLYNHTLALAEFYQYSGSFDSFFKLFMKGEVEYGSYFDFVLDWERVMKTQRDNPILVVEYEKLKTDTVAQIKEIANFLEIEITDEFAYEVYEATKFTKMKTKRTENKLFRKGE